MPKGGRIFVSLTVVFALVCLTFLVRFDKGDIHLALDHAHIGIGDSFFKYWTYLGDGLAFVVVCILLLAMRKSAQMVTSFIATGIAVLLIVGILKNAVFADVSRPWGFFEEGALRVIPGLKQHTNHSFPSGHTTAAFALFGLLAFWVNKSWTSVVLFLVAASVGYSRMFLNQHFLIDVFVGSLLGTLLAWGGHVLFVNKMTGPRWKKPVI